MAKKKRARAEPIHKREKGNIVSWLCSSDAYDILTCNGYTSLSKNPEILAGVDKIANLIGSMTIHLMENKDNGDIRIKNELSRKIDICPNKNMTRSGFIQWIVRTMFLEGNGNAVVIPTTNNGLLEDLLPVPPGNVTLIPESTWNYHAQIFGSTYAPDEILHFTLNPDPSYPWRGTGYKAVLSEVAGNLKQASTTERAFMRSKWKPSLIVKVDGMIDEFASPEGRKRLLDDYITTGEAGEPWMIPAEQFSVEQVKPLSLSDLALSDMVQLDKKTVASILQVPSFLLGVGGFNREEWNNFINCRIMAIAQVIQQELTRKILISPNWYFRLNPRSLYNYDLKDMAAIADDQYVRGIMSGNEVRDWISLPPREGLDDLIILENYIPRGMIGDQKKLNPKGGE